jgi:hypothetical protein
MSFELPHGWEVVESSSRPGMASFINNHTQEKIGWYPTKKAEEVAGRLPPNTARHPVSLIMLDENGNLLPQGWEKVNSGSRPGKFSYKNIYTSERIAWVPQFPAAKEKNRSRDIDEVKEKSTRDAAAAPVAHRRPGWVDDVERIKREGRETERRIVRKMMKGREEQQRRQQQRVKRRTAKETKRGVIHRFTGKSVPAAAARLTGYTRTAGLYNLQGDDSLSPIREEKVYRGGRKTRHRKKHRKKRKTKRVNLENVRKRLRKAILSYEKKEKGQAYHAGDGLQGQRWWLQATPSQRKDFCIFLCRKEKKKLPVCKHHCSPINVFGRHKTRKRRSRKK